MDKEKLIQALDALSLDTHQSSTRPCTTCQRITRILKHPFGCVAHQIAKERGWCHWCRGFGYRIHKELVRGEGWKDVKHQCTKCKGENHQVKVDYG